MTAEGGYHRTVRLPGGADRVTPPPERPARELIGYRLEQLGDRRAGWQRSTQVGDGYLAWPLVQTVRRQSFQIQFGQRSRWYHFLTVSRLIGTGGPQGAEHGVLSNSSRAMKCNSRPKSQPAGQYKPSLGFQTWTVKPSVANVSDHC